MYDLNALGRAIHELSLFMSRLEHHVPMENALYSETAEYVGQLVDMKNLIEQPGNREVTP